MSRPSLNQKLTTQLGIGVVLAVLFFTLWKFKVETFAVQALGLNDVDERWVTVMGMVVAMLMAFVAPGLVLADKLKSYQDEMEGEVSKLTRRYKNIVETTTDLIFQIDPSGRIVYANPAVKLLGYEHGELEGRPIKDLLFNPNKNEILPLITTKRVGHRATYNCPVQLSTSENSVLSSEIPAMEFVMDACGLWEEPDDVVQTKGIQKRYLGTLCVARPVVDRAILAELQTL